jgi:hypothetical protein
VILTDWLRSLLRRPTKPDYFKQAVVESEARNIDRVAKLTGRTPDQVRQEIRRRALTVEIDSMRRAR